jgi:hypothetical protein
MIPSRSYPGHAFDLDIDQTAANAADMCVRSIMSGNAVAVTAAARP